MKPEEFLIKFNRWFNFLIRVVFSAFVWVVYPIPFTLEWFYGILVIVIVWLAFIVDSLE